MLKKTLLLIGLLVLTLSSLGQIVSIPDVNFKNYLLSNTLININGDTLIQISEAAGFTGEIDIANSQVLNLTGLEAFVNITTLSCGYNGLKSLDVSKNTELKYLFCGGNSLNGPYNRITSLDLSKNTKLTFLDCAYNRLSTLDVSNNPLLSVLDCAYNNNLSTLNLSNNLLLTRLEFGFNKFKTINLSKNVELTYLECIGNLLTSLVLTNNTKLTDIYCWSNNLTTLDISNNSLVTSLECDYNKLTTLNIANGRSQFLYGDATGNPNLTCITVDEGVGTLYNFEIDPTAQIGAASTLNCTVFPPVVYIPDANFKAELLANNAINTFQDDEIQVFEAEAYTGDPITRSMYVGSSNISDLTGIEAFTQITSLSCPNNKLTKLNLENNLQLDYLDCSQNLITELDVSPLSLLKTLYCNYNKLQSLDLSNNSNLTSLSCNLNELTSLNLKNITTSLYGNASDNPNLTCILVDEGITKINSFTIDPQTQLSNTCNPISGANILITENDFIIIQVSHNELEIITKKRIGGIIIIDLSGRIVYQNNTIFNDTKTIEVNLNDGIYIVKANYQHKSLTKRIIISQE